MSAVYALFVCKSAIKYKDGKCEYQEVLKPKSEIYGIYSSKKKAKKHIAKALAKKRYAEMQFLRKQTSLPIAITELEWPFEHKYKGFKFKALLRAWDSYALKYVDVRMCISWYCYIEKIVI